MALKKHFYFKNMMIMAMAVILWGETLNIKVAILDLWW